MEKAWSHWSDTKFHETHNWSVLAPNNNFPVTHATRFFYKYKRKLLRFGGEAQHFLSVNCCYVRVSADRAVCIPCAVPACRHNFQRQLWLPIHTCHAAKQTRVAARRRSRAVGSGGTFDAQYVPYSSRLFALSYSFPRLCPFHFYVELT